MIKLLLKHKIVEAAINRFFDAVIVNFQLTDYVLGSDINASHVSREVKYIKNKRNPLMLHQYEQQHITIELAKNYCNPCTINVEHHYCSTAYGYHRNNVSYIYPIQLDDMIWFK